VLQTSVSGAVATLAASLKSSSVLRQASEDALKRQSLSAVSNDMAGSEVRVWTSDGPQESGSSTGMLMEFVSTSVSSEYHSSRNLTVLDGGPSSLWSANHLSEMSIGSELLRVSEPSSTSFRDLAGPRPGTVLTANDTSRTKVFSSVTENPGDVEDDTKLRKMPAEKVDEIDEIKSVVKASEVQKTDQPNYGEGVDKQKDSAAENTSCVLITEKKSEIKHRETLAELMLEAPNENDVVATQSAKDVKRCTPTDVTVEHMTHFLKLERSKTFHIFSEDVPSASVRVAEDVEDDVGNETAIVPRLSGPASVDLKESFCEDLPAKQESVSMVDVLSLNELLAAVDVAPPAVEQEGNLESDHEWPPLPSDEQLLISETELEVSVSNELDHVQDKDTVLPSTTPQAGVSLGPEAGMLAVGASEKILTKAAHLRDDVDSMQRFRYYTYLLTD